MAKDVLNAVKKTKIKTIIFYTPQKYSAKIKKYFGKYFDYKKQTGKNLGNKLKNALKQVNKKYSKIIVIATDIPQISAKIIKSAFKILNKKSCVIGPSPDGGYYLIGFNGKKYMPKVFENISWSTDKVFTQTCIALKKLKLKFAKITELTDIDDLKSLFAFYKQSKNKNLKSVNYIKRNLLNFK
jgi:rSAM/selenodomain-associated transferase 1